MQVKRVIAHGKLSGDLHRGSISAAIARWAALLPRPKHAGFIRHLLLNLIPTATVKTKFITLPPVLVNLLLLLFHRFQGAVLQS